MKATFAIAAVLLVAGVAETVVVDLCGKPYDQYLGLSSYGMRNGQLWQIVTAALLHAGPAHLLINLGLVVGVGRRLEARVGPRRALALYLYAALIGGVAVGLACLASGLQGRLLGPIPTSSAGPLGWLAALALATLRRDKRHPPPSGP